MAALDNAEYPLVIVQHSSHITLLEDYGHLHRYRALKQGDNSLSFYERSFHDGA
jgi:hypothetical protein